MEKSCITDTFYCHFPSCTEQSARKREKLAESRRQDYQNYLKQMSLNDIVANRRHTNYSNNHKVQLNGKFVTNRGYDYNDDIIDANENQTPPRTILTKAIIEAIPATSDAGAINVSNRKRHSYAREPSDLKHTGLPDLFDDEAIKERNRRVAEEDHIRKLEYQRDLLLQIEQKRKQVEKQNALDKEYEEKLSKKLEDHLRTVRMQEKHEVAKQVLNTHIDQIAKSDKNVIRGIESELKARHRIGINRKAQSENGRDSFSKQNTKHIYDYFTNSARQFVESDRNGAAVDDLASIASSLQIVDTKKVHAATDRKYYCRKCQSKVDNGEYDDDYSCKDDEHTHGSIDGPSLPYLCEICSRKVLCCALCKCEICMKCHKRKMHRVMHLLDDIAAIKQDRLRHRAPTTTNDSKETTQYRRDRNAAATIGNHYEDDSGAEHELEVDLSSPVVIKRNTVPYSLYFERNSIFHPSRSDSKLAVKVKNGELFVENDVRSNDDFIEDRLAEIERIADSKLERHYNRRSRDVQHTMGAVLKTDNFRMLEQLEIEAKELDLFR